MSSPFVPQKWVKTGISGLYKNSHHPFCHPNQNPAPGGITIQKSFICSGLQKIRWPFLFSGDLGMWLTKVGAGDGNRTHVTSLEGWSSTIELHPRTIGNAS